MKRPNKLETCASCDQELPLHCNRCEHEWKPRGDVKDVHICPNCKSALWYKPKGK